MLFEDLNILVVGTGSIGTRHIENLLSFNMSVSAYSYREEKGGTLSKKYGIRVFPSIESAFESEPDAVIISNRTDLHMETALAAAQRGIHIYIEKPLSNSMKGINELRRLMESKSLIIEVGCMMRFNPGLRTIHGFLERGEIGKPYFARVCIGQYLPDWRPEQDYNQSYSAKSDYGGGVLFDLIHELDYLYWWFGPVSDVSAFLDRVSELEIETEDVAQILLRFGSGVVAQVEMDYLSPFFRRNCEVVGSKGIIFWNDNFGEVTLKIKGTSEARVFNQPVSFRRNTMFVDLMKHFLNRIKKGGDPAVGLEDGINVLKVALAAHRASETRRAVRPSEV